MKVGDIKEKLFRFLREEEGQSTTEYILILAIVVMIAMRFKKTFTGKITNLTNKIGENIDTAIEEGE